MAKEFSKTSGEPPRLTVPRPGTKPLLVVTDDDGQPVVDLPHYLSWHKATGTFYVGGSEPRAYLKTRDRSLAIMRYRGWVSSFRGKRVVLKHTLGDVTHRGITDTKRKRLRLPQLDYDQPARTSLADHVFWKQIRTAILDDPKLAAKETGITELGYLTDLRPPQPSTKLPDILDAYLSKRRKPSEDEQKKIKRYWNAFVAAVSPAKTVRDIDATALTRWEDKAYVKYNNDGSRPAVSAIRAMCHHQIAMARPRGLPPEPPPVLRSSDRYLTRTKHLRQESRPTGSLIAILSSRVDLRNEILAGETASG